MLGLAAGPTILGHSLLNASIRHLRGQVVSVFNAGQFVFAGVMGFFFFHEVPPLMFYVASTLVASGIAIVVLSSPSTAPRMRLILA